MAAALLLAAAGVLFILRSPSAPAPLPDHVEAFVDSLYRRADYPIDELARFRHAGTEREGFLEQVWSLVAEGLLDW